MNKLALRNHFKALLNRSDITDALADTFIDNGTARIQRTLRIPAMEKQASYSISASTSKITLPVDLIEILDLYFDNHLLNRLSMREMQDHIKSAQVGSPQHFARQQGELLLSPVPSSGTVYLNYYASFSEMLADSDESTLAKIAPDLIIYAALGYASDYYLDERSQLFEAKFQTFMTEIQEQANDAELNGAIQAIRPTALFDLE